MKHAFLRIWVATGVFCAQSACTNSGPSWIERAQLSEWEPDPRSAGTQRGNHQEALLPAPPKGTLLPSPTPFPSPGMQSTPPILEEPPVAVKTSLGEQRIAVLMVRFQDQPVDNLFNVARIQDGFAKASEIFRELSYHQSWLKADIIGNSVWPIPVNAASCATIGLMDGELKKAAQAAAIDLSKYNRIALIYPAVDPNCPIISSGTNFPNPTPDFPSYMWIRDFVSFDVVPTLIHEMGHNYRLGHANALKCANGNSIGSDCSHVGYADPFDLMGANLQGHFSAHHKERLGWLGYGSSPGLGKIVSSGEYFLPPYENADPRPLAWKIARPDGTSLYLEYRQPIGFDGLNSAIFLEKDRPGLLLHIGQDKNSLNSDTVVLVDAHPQTATLEDAQLRPGETLTDPLSGAKIEVLSAGAMGVSFKVTLP
jgi:hypothetical protein